MNDIVMNQGSPEWREMLGKAMEVIAGMQGGGEIDRETRRRVYAEFQRTAEPDATRQLQRALHLVDAALVIAHVFVLKYVEEWNSVRAANDPDEWQTIDLPGSLTSVQDALEAILDRKTKGPSE